MKKLIYAVIIIGIQHLTLSVQHSFGQAPFSTPDNLASGNCLDFDGSNDIVDVGNIGSLGTTFTIEAWGTFAAGTVGHIVSYRSNTLANTFNNISVSVSSGNASFSMRDNALNSASVSSPINANEWYHIAGVRNGNNIELFINGVSVGTNSASFGTFVTNHMDIGGTWHDSVNQHQTNIDGQIDEVRIWNVARTQAQIRDNMCLQLTGSETGLIAYWNMNEGTGNTINDLTSNNNDGNVQEN